MHSTADVTWAGVSTSFVPPCTHWYSTFGIWFDGVDLQSGNLLFGVNDREYQVLTQHGTHDIPEVVLNEHVSTPSQPINFRQGQPVNIQITDFGVGKISDLFSWMLANWIDNHWLRIVQPVSYRAPEVILDAPWSTPIDIWSFGCIVIPSYYFVNIDIRDVRWQIPVQSIGTTWLDFRRRSSCTDDGTCASNGIAIDSPSTEQKC